MEKRHREILVSQRANLVENLNMRDGLFTQLITRKVLNQRMVRSIQVIISWMVKMNYSDYNSTTISIQLRTILLAFSLPRIMTLG